MDSATQKWSRFVKTFLKVTTATATVFTLANYHILEAETLDDTGPGPSYIYLLNVASSLLRQKPICL